LSRRHSQQGLTLVELVSVSAILIVLAGLALPVANTVRKRQKELELRQALRQIRDAIDRFQLDAHKHPGFQKELNVLLNEDRFPEKLEQLYEGMDIGDAAETKLKYLRRLPRDPITGKDEWGTRSSKDAPDSLFSDKTNIFDVHSLSDKVALDGTKYRDW
jgi:general secretion pathway protein G